MSDWRRALVARLDALIAAVLRGLGLLRRPAASAAEAASSSASEPAAPPGPAPKAAREDAEPSLTWWDRLWLLIFKIDLRTSRWRFWAWNIAFLLLWFALAKAVWPDSPWNFTRWMVHLQAAVETLFAGAVWRVLLILLALTFSVYRWAAIYLDDIYELYDMPVAARFIRQAAFAREYESIEIKEGQVPPEYRSSPIVRIGGPGWVIVHAENAALFEKVDGTPHEIGPTVGTVHKGCLARVFPFLFRSQKKFVDGAVLLEGFERLRAVVSLMPHQVTLNMTARTREGVPVRLENITAIYHVARPPEDSTLQQPYPFLKQALINLVYAQEPPWVKGKREVNHRQWVRLAERRLLRSTLANIVAHHSLQEFLSTPGSLEQETLQDVVQDIREQARSFSDTQSPLFPKQDGELGADWLHEFLDRGRIRRRILKQAQARMESLGVTVQWSGSGTWQTPPEISVENHLKAWRISLVNRIRGSEEELNRLRSQARVGTMVRLVREGPIPSFRKVRQSILSEEEQVRAMIRDYLSLLRPVSERLRHRTGGRQRRIVGLIRAVDYLEALCEAPPSVDWENEPEERKP